jgi:hypothetical protein
MPRNPTHYTGATKRVTLAEARQFGSRWVVQPKIDGQFVRLYLDGRGRVAKVFARSGAEVHRGLLDGILGAHLGRPLEAHTEAGNAAAARRGQRMVHLFDCLHDGVRSLVRAPYRDRRDALWRLQSEVVNYGQEAPWLRDEEGRAHDRSTGRYTYARLTDWRVAPIVPQAPLAALESEWERVKATDLEGLVLVNLDAPAGAPASKLKLKPLETIDATVLSVSRTTVTCAWNGCPFMVGRGRHIVDPGEIVEVRHAGWYGGAAVPRFPALVRVRRDLQ